RGGCGTNQKSRSLRSAADGWSVRRDTRAGRFPAELTTPSAPLERDHFLMARPPLLQKEGNKLAPAICSQLLQPGDHKPKPPSRRAVDEIFANAVSCERALALQLQQLFFTQADPVDDVNLFAIRLDFARESDSGLGQFG